MYVHRKKNKQLSSFLSLLDMHKLGSIYSLRQISLQTWTLYAHLLTSETTHCSSHLKNERTFRSKHTVTTASAVMPSYSTDDDVLVEGREQDSLLDGEVFFWFRFRVAIFGFWIFPLLPLVSSAESELLFLQIKDKNPNGFRPPLFKTNTVRMS